MVALWCLGEVLSGEALLAMWACHENDVSLAHNLRITQVPPSAEETRIEGSIYESTGEKKG